MTSNSEGCIIEGVEPTFICKHCLLPKVRVEFRQRTDTAGWRTVCLTCEIARKKENYREHRAERVAAQVVKQENNVAYRRYQRIYRATVSGKMSATGWTAADIAKFDAPSYAYYARGPRPLTEAEWKFRKQRQKDVRTAAMEKRRARVAETGGAFTFQEWADLKLAFGYCCLKCGKQEPEIVLSADHVVPLARGGTNTIENIQPLCVSCNCKKHTKTIDYRVATQLGQEAYAA